MESARRTQLRCEGRDQFEQFYHAILAGIPDVRVTITKIIEQDHWVAARFVCDGTHTGPGLGVPPTHKRVTFSALGMGRMEKQPMGRGLQRR